MSWSPWFSELIKLLPLTWFPDLVNFLPSEQLEISSTDRLGLQRAAEEDVVLWRSSGGTSAEPLPVVPSQPDGPRAVELRREEGAVGAASRAGGQGCGAPRHGIFRFQHQ